MVNLGPEHDGINWELNLDAIEEGVVIQADDLEDLIIEDSSISAEHDPDPEAVTGTITGTTTFDLVNVTVDQNGNVLYRTSTGTSDLSWAATPVVWGDDPEKDREIERLKREVEFLRQQKTKKKSKPKPVEKLKRLLNLDHLKK